MRHKVTKLLVLLTVTAFLSVAAFEVDAFARAGGGRSSGSRGSRSYSTPSRPQPSQSREQSAPAQPVPPAQQPSGGGFLRGLGGGILGGLLGGMLFRNLGFGGLGDGFGGSGVGLFEIILVAGIGFLIYRMAKRKREESLSYQSPYFQGSNRGGDTSFSGSSAGVAGALNPVKLDEGLSYLRQMDPSFDEARFKDTAMDIFFKIQGAWMHRDLSPAGNLLTDEMRDILQNDVDQLIREKHVNRLENIAVRNVEITEVWQESGQDFITALLYANLLDYTTNESTGEVVAGSRTDPVKFEEYWTFTRPVGNNAWRLSAINQV